MTLEEGREIICINAPPQSKCDCGHLKEVNGIVIEKCDNCKKKAEFLKDIDFFKG